MNLLARFFQSAKSYLNLIGSSQIYIATALLATVAAEILQLIQPIFIRGFIDYYGSGMSPKSLIWFPVFMVGVAILAYIFDYISVAIRFLLSQAMDIRMKEIYIGLGQKQEEQGYAFALRAGLANLAKFTLHMGIQNYIHVARLLLILSFICFENLKVGLLSVATLIFSILISLILTKKIGRFSVEREDMVSRFLNLNRDKQRKQAIEFADSLDKQEIGSFNCESLIFVLTFFTFSLLPVSVLLFALFGSEISLGQLASLMLFLSMLRGPYMDFIQFVRECIVYYSDSEIFREDFDRSVKLEMLLRRLPIGLILDPSLLEYGKLLSEADSDSLESNREFYDDLPRLVDPKTKVLNLEKLRVITELVSLAKKQSILIHSGDPYLHQFAHFVQDQFGDLSTTLEKLTEQQRSKDAVTQVPVRFVPKNLLADCPTSASEVESYWVLGEFVHE